MNPIAANAFLKTLEEPAGARAVPALHARRPIALLPTIRSRCQSVALAAAAARAGRGVAGEPRHRRARGAARRRRRPARRKRSQLAERGVDAAAWRALAGAGRRAATRRRFQRLAAAAASSMRCKSSATTRCRVACGAAPRYFPRGASAALPPIWPRCCAGRASSTRLAEEAEHPWSVDLAVESLVEQGREALKTPRSPGRERRGLVAKLAPDEPNPPPAPRPAQAPRRRRPATRPSVIQLVFRETGALYAAYMPMFSEGGIFVPTTRDYKLGEDIYLLLSLPDDPQRYPVAGKVGWITPANASGGRTQGVGVRFPTDEKSRAPAAADRGSARHRRSRRPSRRRRSERPRRRSRQPRDTPSTMDPRVRRFPLPSELPELAARLPEIRAAMAAAEVDRALCICTTLDEFERVHALAIGARQLLVQRRRPSRTNEDSPRADASRICVALRGAAQGRRDRRDRARLLPSRRAQRRRHGVAARAVSRPHPRRASERPAARHPHPQRCRRHLRRPAREEGGERAGGVFHCFTETAEVARAALDLGFFISFSGILTFKNAADSAQRRGVRAARSLPDRDRQPLSGAGAVSRQGQLRRPTCRGWRGKLAEIKGVPVETIAAATSAQLRTALRCALFHELT